MASYWLNFLRQIRKYLLRVALIILSRELCLDPYAVAVIGSFLKEGACSRSGHSECAPSASENSERGH